MQNKYEILHEKLKKKKLKNSQKVEDNITTPSKFYFRVVNNTNINFSKDELAIHSKGLKYNLHFKQKNWISTLALEKLQLCQTVIYIYIYSLLTVNITQRDALYKKIKS